MQPLHYLNVGDEEEWLGGDNKEIVKQWTMNNGKKTQDASQGTYHCQRQLDTCPKKKKNSYSFKSCNDNQITSTRRQTVGFLQEEAFDVVS